MRSELERMLGTRQISAKPNLRDCCLRFYQQVNMEGGWGGGPSSFIPINPELAGGVIIDLRKSTQNTAVLKEEVAEGLQNIYFHHDGRNSPGRMALLEEMREPLFHLERIPEGLRELYLKK